MTVRRPVALTKRVPAGAGVSYGHTYVTERETTLALVPVGYADGVPRAAGNRGAGAGRRARSAPIAGRVCMDQFVLDVGDDDVRAGRRRSSCGARATAASRPRSSGPTPSTPSTTSSSPASAAGSPAATSARPGRSDGRQAAKRTGLTGASPGTRPPASSAACVGLAAAGTAAGVAVSRWPAAGRAPAAAPTRSPRRPEHTAAELRADDPLGAAARRRRPDGAGPGRRRRAARRSRRSARSTAPLTVVFVHGYTLSMASWTFQRRTLAARARHRERAPARTPGWSSTTSAATAPRAAGPPSTRRSSSWPATSRRSSTPGCRAGRSCSSGHSMGGMTIMGLAALRPELFGSRVVGVALMSTSSGNLADLNFGLPRAAHPRPRRGPPGGGLDHAPPAAVRRAHPADGRGRRLGRDPVAVVRLQRRRPRARRTTSTR